ncbi:MAG: hypothetical protein WC716_13725 [Chitinophagaceae bacterium]|jgi:hypothetical protein
MKYEQYNYTDKAVILDLLNSLDQEKRVQAIIGMINGIDDTFWLQDKLIKLIHDGDFWVSKNAITALGDLARIHRKLDVDKVIHELQKISNASFQDIIRDTISDIKLFVR